MPSLTSLLSPTALALALTTALSPLAAAAPRPASDPPAAVPELPGPGAPRSYHVTRLPPSTPVSNKPATPSNTGFAQPPSGWSGELSVGAVPVAPEEIVPVQIIVTKEAVRAALEEARKTSLAAFQQYLSDQIYPSNTYKKGALNVWRDENGHFCAAATMIRMSGRVGISDDIGNTQNNLRLINVKSGVLMDWILTSGLTQQEIDRIQMPFIDVRPDGPQRPVWGGEISAKKRLAETTRLFKAYTATYAALQKSNKASLEVAVNRLMAHPDLARDFLDGSLAARDLH